MVTTISASFQFDGLCVMSTLPLLATLLSANIFVKIVLKTSIKMGNELVCTCEGFKITDNDLKTLTENGYINDTIINVVLKHFHRHLLNEEQQKRVHIFDTFFVEAIQMQKADYIRRWLFNIFEKDYLIMPVNLGFHWFLMILNHPNKLFDAGDHSTTCIQVMDSMGIGYETEKKQNLYKAFFTFLQAAAAVYKNKMLARPWESFPITAIDVEIQNNPTDCGIHLLMNAEKFLIGKYHTFTCQLSRMNDKRAGLEKLIRNAKE